MAEIRKPLVMQDGRSRQGMISVGAVEGLTEALSDLAPKVNDIRKAGAIGFGVGICPPWLLPPDTKPLSAAYVLGSDNYGNYIHEPSESIMVWVPAHWYRWGHSDSPNHAEYGPNALDILPFSAFPDRAAAALQGYALDRAAVDDGVIQPGYFVDKYLVSNLRGVAASVRYGNPLSSSAAHNPFSGLIGSPANNYSGIIAAAKTRGPDFFPASIFIYTSLQRLSVAHAQASRSTAGNAWYDIAGVMNFPKGCNNNALRDASDTSVVYVSDGYQNCGKTGSGTPFEKTTHNGQASGICDLSGPMWRIALGMTTLNNKYYALSEQARMAGLTAGAAGATDAWGGAGVAANYVEAGATWGDLRADDASRLIGSVENPVYSGATDGVDWHMAGAGVPLLGGTGGSNLFGNDGLWDYRPTDMCPVACGYWSSAGRAGPGARNFYYARGRSSCNVGGCAALYLVRRSDSDWRNES